MNERKQERPAGEEPRLERVAALFAAAFPPADPPAEHSSALEQRLAALAARPAGWATRWRRPLPPGWAPAIAAAAAALLLVFGISRWDRGRAIAPRPPLPSPQMARVGPAETDAPLASMPGQGRRETGIQRRDGRGTTFPRPSRRPVKRTPIRPEGDLTPLRSDPAEVARWWAPLSEGETDPLASRLGHLAQVRDDFVRISFPRLASTSERQIAQAVASYQKEAAIVDTRLAREVTLQQKATALSDLCERLRSDTGIQLAAGQSVADEKVTLFCRAMPLREVMRQLSRPFGYTWLRSGKAGAYRYELVQDLRSQLLEEELRNRDRNAALLALEREIDRYRPYLGLSPDEALARSKTAPPDEKLLLEKLATDGWGPIQMYFRLSRRDLAVLRAGQRLTFSAEPRPGEQPLPPDLARGILACQRNVRLIRGEHGLEFASDLTDPRSLSLISVPEARAQVRLEISQSELGQFTLAGSSGLFTTADSHTSGRVDRPFGVWSLSSSGPWAAGMDPAVIRPDSPLANARLARDPALCVRVTVRPQPSCVEPSPSPSPKRRGERLPLSASGRGPGGGVNRVTTADVLEALYRAAGMPIVADYYTRLFPADTASVQAMPLFEALNHLAAATRLRWNKEGDWLQFRSASFFNDRLKEVPNRLLGRWAASRRQHGALTLEDLVEIAQLPDAQLDADDVAEGANSCFGLVEWNLARKRLLRPHLRYLAQLTRAQREAALSSTGLPFTQMSLSQQQEFIARALLPGAEPLQSVDELAGAALRVDYSLPGRFEWRVPGPTWLQWVAPLEPGLQGRRVLRPVVQEPDLGAALQKLRHVDPQVREAVLQAAGRADPRIAQAPPADEAQIAPTQRHLAIIYIPGASNARPLHVLTDDGNELAPPTW